ncbi:MAG TPA: glycerate kinase, partial [Candidatus Methylacidiphilales bacterium]
MKAPSFLIAPDKFKGTLSAREAAEALARGIARVAPQASVRLLPLSDGGEGFVETLAAARGGKLHAVSAIDPLGR